jgi:hypothetical protein
MNPKGKPKVNLLNFQDYKGRVRIYGVKNSDWVLSSKEPLTRLKVPPSSAGIGALYVQAGKLRLLDDSVAVDLPILAEPAKETIVTLMPNNLVLEETKSRKRPREELAECLQKNISRKKHCPDRYYPEKKSKKKLDELPLQGPLTRKEDNKIKRRVMKEKKFWHIM